MYEHFITHLINPPSMEQESALSPYVQTILLLIFLLPLFLFLLTQQNLLKNIRPQNRTLNPGKVWLQLIPGFGLVYQFIVIRQIANSIYREFVDPIEEDSILSAYEDIPDNPTYRLGLNFTILFLISLFPIPLLKTVVSIGALIMWIWYWAVLVRYNKKIRQRLAGL